VNLPEIEAEPGGTRRAHDRAILRLWHIAERAAVEVLGDHDRSQDVASRVLRRLLSSKASDGIVRLGEKYFRAAGRTEALALLRRARRRAGLLAQVAGKARARPVPRRADFAFADTLRRLGEWTECLPPRTSEVARLTWFEGWTAREIADELGLAVKRVERHRRLARERLLRDCPDLLEDLGE
jgi:RNA polymerase sigma factor (sigma-70 family)